MIWFHLRQIHMCNHILVLYMRLEKSPSLMSLFLEMDYQWQVLNIFVRDKFSANGGLQKHQLHYLWWSADMFCWWRDLLWIQTDIFQYNDQTGETHLHSCTWKHKKNNILICSPMDVRGRIFIILFFVFHKRCKKRIKHNLVTWHMLLCTPHWSPCTSNPSLKIQPLLYTAMFLSEMKVVNIYFKIPWDVLSSTFIRNGIVPVFSNCKQLYLHLKGYIWTCDADVNLLSKLVVSWRLAISRSYG